MLSYQHSYHAGNLGDLHKHIILSALWREMKSKPRPLTYIDTHAGRSIYDLQSAHSAKTGEWREGFGRYQGGAKDYDEALASFEQKIGADYYPGSAALIASMRDPDDRIICAEKHPGEFDYLRDAMGSQAETYFRDGYELLLELSPPPTRRGLALIDPSYEIKSEYGDVPTAVKQALAKWPDATIAVWYPILQAGRHQEIENRLELNGRMIFRAHYPSNSKLRMLGSAVLVLGAPHKARERIETALASTTSIFSKLETVRK